MMIDVPPGTEVARMLAPLPVRGINRLVRYLERAYGPGLVMRSTPDLAWFIFATPQAPDSGPESPADPGLPDTRAPENSPVAGLEGA